MSALPPPLPAHLLRPPEAPERAAWWAAAATAGFVMGAWFGALGTVGGPSSGQLLAPPSRAAAPATASVTNEEAEADEAATAQEAFARWRFEQLRLAAGAGARLHRARWGRSPADYQAAAVSVAGERWASYEAWWGLPSAPQGGQPLPVELPPDERRGR